MTPSDIVRYRQLRRRMLDETPRGQEDAVRLFYRRTGHRRGADLFRLPDEVLYPLLAEVAHRFDRGATLRAIWLATDGRVDAAIWRYEIGKDKS